MRLLGNTLMLLLRAQMRLSKVIENDDMSNLKRTKKLRRAYELVEARIDGIDCAMEH